MNSTTKYSKSTFFIGCCVVLLSVSVSQAGVVTLNPASLTDLLGSSPTALETLLQTDLVSDTLVTKVYSHVYTDG